MPAVACPFAAAPSRGLLNMQPTVEKGKQMKTARHRTVQWGEGQCRERGSAGRGAVEDRQERTVECTTGCEQNPRVDALTRVSVSCRA